MHGAAHKKKLYLRLGELVTGISCAVAAFVTASLLNAPKTLSISLAICGFVFSALVMNHEFKSKDERGGI